MGGWRDAEGRRFADGPVVTTRGKAAVAANLRSVVDEGTDALEKVGRTTRKLSLEGTATLVGTFGGFMAVSAAYALSILAPAVSLAVAGPLALGLGITGGLLAFRGTAAAKLDRELDDRRREANYLLERLSLLPKTAPKEVREGLYLEYQRIVTKSHLLTAPLLLMQARPEGTPHRAG